MTETVNFKLKKPDLTDPVNVNDFNENFDIIDDALSKGGNSYLDLDLTAYSVDYAAESEALDVTNAVPSETIKALANGAEKRPVRVTFSSGGSTTVNMVLPDRYKTAEGYYRYFGTSGNLSYASYATMFLQPRYDEATGVWSLVLQCYANQLKDYVKTGNGIDPDPETGNVTTTYTIDLSEVVKVNFSNTSMVTKYPLDGVDVDGLRAAHESGMVISLKIGSLGADGNERSFLAILDNYTEFDESLSFNGVTAYAADRFILVYLWINPDSSVGLAYRATIIDKLVKTVNGIAPDENGNVEVETAEEKPVNMDLSGYKDGTIRLTYADGGTMDVTVTFDEAGNPISFSNGTEEFTVTWPAEESTTEETTEEGTA